MKNYEPEEFKDELERLKQENEIKRMKLRLEYGADFPIESQNNDLPPHLESQFLDSVAQFEKAFHNSDRISVYDFIGKPDYRKTESIPDSEISAELDRIIQILNQNQIDLNTLCEVDDRVLYQFITEELFFTETDNMRIDGWISTFTYEEFHQNHEYDLRNSCTEFFESFLGKESDLYTSLLTKEAERNSWFENFRKAFNSFTLNHFEITNLQHDELTAKVQFNISFSGIIEGSNETEYFSGLGEMNFLYQWGYWYVQEITLPSNQK
jgi:hypothetical protein